MKMEKMGEYAFLVGVAVAVIAVLIGSAIPGAEFVPLALVVLGLAVGFLNVSEKETTPFLIAAIALTAAGTSASGTLGLIPGVGQTLAKIVNNIAVFVVPGAILVALKAVWALASKK